MFGESLLYFTTTKLITIKNKKVGLFNTFIQMCILSYILWDLFYHELYKEVEIPSGYTAFWTENGNLTSIQEKTNVITIQFCNNDTYNYAYDVDEWDYTNISCVKLPYAEMYEKGESEFFFLTHFTEYDVNVKNCPNSDNKCLNKTNKEFFTIGVEGMLLAFDHFYTTTFQQGSNLGNSGLKLVDTVIKDVDGNHVETFNKGETIKLYVEEWLNYAKVSLDEINEGTPVSVNHPYVENPIMAYNRLSGIEIIIKVSYHNIKYFSGYDTPTCEINIQPNSGWSSKGSLINYVTYPNISDINDSYNYIDRYRYGIKFKFIVSGLMGEFNLNALITHLVSGIVLVNMSTIIVSLFLTYFSGEYGKFYQKVRNSKISINTKCFWEKSKCCKNKVDSEEENEANENLDNLEIHNEPVERGITVRKRKRKKVRRDSGGWLDISNMDIESEASYNYTSIDESIIDGNDEDKEECNINNDIESNTYVESNTNVESILDNKSNESSKLLFKKKNIVSISSI